MRKRFAFCVLSLTWFGSCKARVAVPGDVQISCRSTHECPRGFECEPTIGLCVQPGKNHAPTVTVGAIARTTGDVLIPVTAFDADGDDVTVDVEYKAGGGFVPAPGAGATLTASPAGVAQVLHWDAAAAFGDTSYHPGLQLRLTPHDATSTGPVVVSDPFDFGNDAPVIVSLAVDDASVRGLTVVRFAVSDSSADFVHIVSFDLSPAGDFSDTVSAPLSTGASSVFPAGALSSLATSTDSAGTEHTLTWDSRQLWPADAEGARLRLAIADDLGGTTTEVSPIFAVDNQTPPHTETVYVKSDGDVHNGAIAIVYRAVDEESDPIDVRVEYSRDGFNWYDCSELAVPRSEGRYDLATAPGSEGGIVHTFIWDSGANLFGRSNSVRVQITAADSASGAGEPTLVLPAGPVGIPALAPNDSAFAAADTYDVGSNNIPESILYADVSGDGLPDLVAGINMGGGSDTVGVWLGQGAAGVADGSFVAAANSPFAAGPIPENLVSADFNEDGLLDIAEAARNTLTAPVTFLLTDDANLDHVWDGTFTVGTEDVGYPPNSLATGDFNGDLHTDVAVASVPAPGLKLLFGAGDGSFTLGPVAEATRAGYGVAARDFDGDGILDVALIAQGDSDSEPLLEVFHGDGKGGFTLSGSYPVGLPHVWTMLSDDFNGDGAWDVVVRNDSPGAVACLLNQGNGEFAAPRVSPGGYGTYMASGDVSGDGIADLVLNSSAGVQVLVGEGASGWGEGRFDLGALLPIALKGVRIADVNADGLLDLVGGWNSNVGVVKAQAQTAFSSGSLATATTFAVGDFPRAATLGDFNADGLADLAVLADDGLEILMGRGTQVVPDGSFELSTVMPLLGILGERLLNADFNGDGILDLAVVYWWSPGLAIFLGGGRDGVGDGTFTLFDSYDVGAYPRCIASADFNGDGALDLAVGNYDQGPSAESIYVLLANAPGGVPDGTFAAAVPYAAKDDMDELVANDIDSDGIIDLVTVSEKTDELVVLRGKGSGGRGDGTFGTAETYTTLSLSRPSGVTLADVNGDGVEDALVAQSTGAGLGVFLGQTTGGVADGTFAGVQSYRSYGAWPRSPIAADFDDDGILDVALVSEMSFTIDLLHGQSSLGLGTGVFDDGVGIATGVGPWQQVVGDVNADGMLDCITTDVSGNDIGVLTGRREGFRSSWAVALSAANVFGSTILPSGRDRFGRSRFATLSQHRFQGGRVSGGDFRSLLRRSGLPPPARGAAGVHELRPLTQAWYTSGERRLMHVDDATGARYQVFEPLAASLGLDLTSTDASVQRGVIIDLPIVGARSNDDINSAVSVRVYARFTDWLRASEVPDDPMAGQPEAIDYLPRLETAPGSGKYRDVVKERDTFVEISRDADGALATGSGPRFIVDTSDSKRRVVRVLTDRLGVFQAFLE